MTPKQALQQSNAQVAKAYKDYRKQQEKKRKQEKKVQQERIPLDPAFIIDPTEPEWRLEIQRQFAVEREARIMDNNGDKRAEYERIRWKSTVQGRYYLDSELPSQDPSVDLIAECRAITKYLQTNYGNSPDEYEAAYQDKEWLPKNLASLALIRPNGRTRDDNEWEEKQKEIGYWLPEVVRMSVLFKKKVEEVRFFEGNATK